MKNGIFGGVAQLVERSVRIREVMGSNPTVSTKKASAKAGAFFFLTQIDIPVTEIYNKTSDHILERSHVHV